MVAGLVGGRDTLELSQILVLARVPWARGPRKSGVEVILAALFASDWYNLF